MNLLSDSFSNSGCFALNTICTHGGNESYLKDYTLFQAYYSWSRTYFG